MVPCVYTYGIGQHAGPLKQHCSEVTVNATLLHFTKQQH